MKKISTNKKFAIITVCIAVSATTAAFLSKTIKAAKYRKYASF